jgi:hypothetical protein
MTIEDYICFTQDDSIRLPIKEKSDDIITIQKIKMIDDDTGEVVTFLYVLKKGKGYPKQLPYFFKLKDNWE